MTDTDLLARRRELERILRDVTPIIMEGYSPCPGSDPHRVARLGTVAKTSHKDLVTLFDQRAEAFIIGELAKSFAGEAVIGEEATAAGKVKPSQSLVGAPSHFWLIDPIDGTTNFSRAYPFFCSTAAFMEKTAQGIRALVGAVWDPVHGEMFSASLGGGAWLNRDRLRCAQVSDPKASLLTTGFASERNQSGSRAFELFTALTRHTLGVRRDGSAALDLSYVAAGRIDGYWEWGLAPWDTAAGSLLVSEAEGKVTSLEGNLYEPATGEILASNGFLHKWLLDRIKGSEDESA